MRRAMMRPRKSARGFAMRRRYLSMSGLKPTSTYVQNYINEIAKTTKPAAVHVCDGSEEEEARLIETLISTGTIKMLNPDKRPNSYLARSDPKDVARVEEFTYICSKDEADAGPTNNWVEPKAMKEKLNGMFDGAMKGRTMYVVPFSMGPLGSDIAKLGLQVTDSPYVALSLKTMTRMGKGALDLIESANGEDVIPCYHTLGAPLEPGQKDVPWPCNATKRIVHFPDEPSIWSFGSGYGGNALLGKKCLALRIASSLAKEEGWMAEHMLIISITNPEGRRYNVAAAFPSACGKTNLAMLQPTIPGWKVQTVGDDIAWMKFGDDGKLYAINPENGFFGVAPGTSVDSNPMAMRTIEKNTIFTNVAETDDGDVWWEGMSDAPEHLVDWKGNDWTPASKAPAAHPNSRFCTPAGQCPVIDPAWNDPKGVAIDAILFGGRRATTVPLVSEAFTWNHGTFMGAAVSSELTAAAEGTVGTLRHDPFAMLPFCGYNMGDYFQHWLDIGKTEGATIPKIFTVNWFRKDKDGKFAWPGFGENSRVLKWVCERIDDKDNKLATKTPIGYIPSEGALDVSGLDVDTGTMKELFEVNPAGWNADIKDTRNYFAQFGDRLPAAMTEEMDKLETRLNASV